MEKLRIKTNQDSQKFYKPVCETLYRNEMKKENVYYKSLSELSYKKGFNILSCNDKKAMCIDQDGLYVLICYIHDKEKGYALDTTKQDEYFQSWKEFKKDYLNKLEVA